MEKTLCDTSEQLWIVCLQLLSFPFCCFVWGLKYFNSALSGEQNEQWIVTFWLEQILFTSLCLSFTFNYLFIYMYFVSIVGRTCILHVCLNSDGLLTPAAWLFVKKHTIAFFILLTVKTWARIKHETIDTVFLWLELATRAYAWRLKRGTLVASTC